MLKLSLLFRFWRVLALGVLLVFGSGVRLSLLVLHDDEKREYAYGPAQGLPDTQVGTFTQSLYDEAKMQGWIAISMKYDWKDIFAFEYGDRVG